MRILYLITKSEFGGAQTHVADICRYFNSKGYEISVMSKGGGWLEGECKKNNINFVSNLFFGNTANPLNIWRAIKGIQKYVAVFKPDIIHCHSSAAAFLGRIAIRGKIRTIYTAHGWGFNIGMKPWIKYPVLSTEKFCARFTDTYICVAEFVKKLAMDYELAEEDKFRVVYNGVKSDPSCVNDKSDKNKIIFVGRLAEPKIPELVIKAIAGLPVSIKKSIDLTIVGDGPKKELLR